MTMPRPGPPTTSHVSDDGQARIVIAAAPRLDDLIDLVTAEVTRILPSDLASLFVGSTSLAPRDEAARAARWIARSASQRGVSATLVDPISASSKKVGWMSYWSRGDLSPAAPQASVGVARLDLSPTVGSVDQPYAVGLWLPMESASIRLRRHTTTDLDQRLVDAAVAARPVATVLIGRVEQMAIVLVGADLLAVEVMGRALHAAAQPVGDLGISPWQAPVVQRSVESGAGVTHPDLIGLESIWLGAGLDRGHDRFHRIIETASGRAGIGRVATAPSSPSL